MSCTGRGTIRDEKDFYATPLPSFNPVLSFLPRNAHYWEPCAGDGRLIHALRQAGFAADGAEPYPVPMYPGFDCVGLPQIDYLADVTPRDFTLTNPPFSLAFEMAQHALLFSREVMFLLRISFLESEERGDWLSENEPNALFPLKKRPSFVMSCTCKACGHNWLLPIEAERPKVCPVCGSKDLRISTSDNAAYAWFYWGRRFQGIHHL